MRYKLLVEYEGTRYLGWQVQPHGPTIQGEMEAALRKLCGQEVRVAAAGRTDAGVHASGQVVSFVLERTWPTESLLRALNAVLPHDIAVTGAEQVADSFDPRRDATSRTYLYRIWNRRVPSPFWRRFSWHVFYPLDERAMQAAAATLVGEHDFASFQAAGCQAAHAVRRVVRSEVERQEDMILYRIEANAFVRHMVRNIVGTLVEVGRGQLEPQALAMILERRDRTHAGPTAPAHGLCLSAVRYSGAPRPRLRSENVSEA